MSLQRAAAPGNAPKPAPARFAPDKRFRRIGLLFGALMLVLVAVLVFQAVNSASRYRDTILHHALEKGFWIARSLEIGHSLLLQEQQDAMRDLVREITLHPHVESLLVLDEDLRVLAASDTGLEGTRWPQTPGDTPEHGSVLSTDLRRAQLAFPAHFAESSARMGNMHPDRDRSMDLAKWIVVTLDTSEGYAHYESGVLQSILALSLSVALSLGAVFAFRVMQRTLMLEQIRLGLGRFVPRSVQQLIEDNPEQPMLDKVERDATVLFLDIDRYTSLSEEIPAGTLNRLVERYFSAFLDTILSQGGEINETAGDGVMAIFTGEAADAHARNAVAAAMAIRERTRKLNLARAPREPEILVNIGINTGRVLLGATMIKGAAGEHLTYTASGTVTNLAARLCDLGEKGEICLSGATAELLSGQIPLSGPLQTRFKNVREPVQVYRVA